MPNINTTEKKQEVLSEKEWGKMVASMRRALGESPVQDIMIVEPDGGHKIVEGSCNGVFWCLPVNQRIPDVPLPIIMGLENSSIRFMTYGDPKMPVVVHKKTRGAAPQE